MGEAELFLVQIADHALQKVRSADGLNNLNAVDVPDCPHLIDVLVPRGPPYRVMNSLNDLIHCEFAVEQVLCPEQRQVLEVLIAFLHAKN